MRKEQEAFRDNGRCGHLEGDEEDPVDSN